GCRAHCGPESRASTPCAPRWTSSLLVDQPVGRLLYTEHVLDRTRPRVDFLAGHRLNAAGAELLDGEGSHHRAIDDRFPDRVLAAAGLRQVAERAARERIAGARRVD